MEDINLLVRKKMECPKLTCPERGIYVYCYNKAGKYAHRFCQFYTDQRQHKSLEHNLTEEKLKTCREDGL